jgi:hypothetical protein
MRRRQRKGRRWRQRYKGGMTAIGSPAATFWLSPEKLRWCKEIVVMGMTGRKEVGF